MASTFSPTLRLELVGDGDQSGIWGQTTNANLGTLVEQAVTGVVTITMLDANYTMTNFNGVADEARNAVIVLTGTLTAQRNLIAPLVEKTYSVKNSTTGGLGVQIVGASGTGVVIPNGQTIPVYCDGTNFYALVTGSVTNFNVAGNLAVTGTTALSGALSGTTLTGTNHIGPGTGLTGTAAGLSIGGNAATATNSTTTSQTNFSNLTISGNQVLSAANYNSYAPTLGGGGASGTWGINITGNSATVTNGVYNNGGTYSINVTGSSGFATSAGSATTAGTANLVNINYNNGANSAFQVLWGSGTGVYGNGTLLVNPALGNLTASGNLTAYSDERLKTNWNSLQEGFVAQLAKVKSGTYDRTDVELTQAGVSAQSLQALLPEVVDVDEKGMLSVNYGPAALVAAIELAKEVTALRAELEELKRGK